MKEELKQYEKYLKFIDEYSTASNAATGSKYDANSNVENKNITTMTGEIPKGDMIGINRLCMWNKLKELYGETVADQYIDQLERHEIYRHDETSIYPYCCSITLYPFLSSGMKNIGGGCTAPHNLDSFCGSFINLCFAVAAQFAGAVATPEFLSYMDYFIRKDYGDDYYLRSDEVVDMSARKRTIDKIITDHFEQITYSLNQPAAARSFQSIFWNIAYFDKPYFEGMFEDFFFPDGTQMQWESVSWLQKRFMNWLNEERLRHILTFPVETMNLLDNGSEYVDKEWADFTAEMLSKGHSFFIYRSDSVDSLASCCRLRNEMQDNTFSYTLGAGGVSTGSKGVITINMNRLVQNLAKEKQAVSADDIVSRVTEQVEQIHKYLLAWNQIVHERYEANLLPIYNAGYIGLDKQYLTVGINGWVEACEFLGLHISADDKEYISLTNQVLTAIKECNRAARTADAMFNTEYVPKMRGHKAA